MKVVLDTNVLFAALVADGLCRELFRRVIRAKALATCEPLLLELEEILSRKLHPTPAVTRFLAALRRQVTLVEPVPLAVPVCRDPDDDVVLATAVAARATAIVTGDADLLVLREYGNIPILSPRQLLEFLDQRVSDE